MMDRLRMEDGKLRYTNHFGDINEMVGEGSRRRPGLRDFHLRQGFGGQDGGQEMLKWKAFTCPVCQLFWLIFQSVSLGLWLDSKAGMG